MDVRRGVVRSLVGSCLLRLQITTTPTRMMIAATAATEIPMINFVLWSCFDGVVRVARTVSDVFVTRSDAFQSSLIVLSVEIDNHSLAIGDVMITIEIFDDSSRLPSILMRTWFGTAFVGSLASRSCSIM